MSGFNFRLCGFTVLNEANLPLRVADRDAALDEANAIAVEAGGWPVEIVDAATGEVVETFDPRGPGSGR